MRNCIKAIIVGSGLVLTGCSSVQGNDSFGSALSTARQEKMKMIMEPSASASKNSVFIKAPSVQERVMIYNASITVIVENIADSLGQLQVMAKQGGGYMQSMSASSIVLRIPVARFQNLVTKIGAIGEVTHKEIKGSDVTDQMRDLKIRLSNAVEMRKRLVKLLEKAEKVEDMLKIEKELERITASIELFKGKVKSIAHKAAFSTVTVSLNSPVPQRVLVAHIPFPWTLELASEMMRGQTQNSYMRTDGKHVDFELPQSFAKFQQDNYVTRATSAEGVLIKVSRHKNVDGGTLKFWSTLVRKALVEKRAMSIKPMNEIKLKGGKVAILLTGTKDVSTRKMSYQLAIAVVDEYVYIYEAWGDVDSYKTVKLDILNSMKSMHLNAWF